MGRSRRNRQTCERRSVERRRRCMSLAPRNVSPRPIAVVTSDPARAPTVVTPKIEVAPIADACAMAARISGASGPAYAGVAARHASVMAANAVMRFIFTWLILTSPRTRPGRPMESGVQAIPASASPSSRRQVQITVAPKSRRATLSRRRYRGRSAFATADENRRARQNGSMPDS
jgi:hypothetical protein